MGHKRTALVSSAASVASANSVERSKIKSTSSSVSFENGLPTLQRRNMETAKSLPALVKPVSVAKSPINDSETRKKLKRALGNYFLVL